MKRLSAGLGLLLLLAAAPLAARPAPATEPPPLRLADLVDVFVALCLEGAPTPEQSAERALAAGWSEVGGARDLRLPPGERLAVMTQGGMIFVLQPAARDGEERGCQVAANFSGAMTLDELAAPLSARPGMGPHSVERFGPRDAAFWRSLQGLTVIAFVPSPEGPRTHGYMVKQRRAPSGPSAG